jgi:hypothetical protein
VTYLDPYFRVDISPTLKRAGLDGVIGKYRIVCLLFILEGKREEARQEGRTEVAAAYAEAIGLIRGMLIEEVKEDEEDLWG